MISRQLPFSASESIVMAVVAVPGSRQS